MRQRPVARRFPAVDQDDAGAGRAAAGGDEPGREPEPSVVGTSRSSKGEPRPSGVQTGGCRLG